MRELTANEVSAPTPKRADDDGRRPLLTALPGSWTWAVAFMLSLSALGLKFYPALLVILFCMANRLKHNRYDFIIQLTLLLGGFAIVDASVTVFNTSFLVFALGIFFAVILRKHGILGKAIWAWVAYTAVLFVLAYTSEESMRVQLRHFVGYSVFIYFAVPVAVFSGKEFRMDDFVRALLPYCLILAVYYILDAYLLSGWVLVPHSFSWGATSAFYDLAWAPLSGWIVRKYPPGLYLLTLLVLPLARAYRLRLWQWAIVVLALIATQTFTIISGFTVFFLLFQNNWKRVMMLAGLGSVAAVAVYFIDGSMAQQNDDYLTVSPLRIYSSVNQIMELGDAVDAEDVADFGSGRIGQALPKLELLYNLGYQWRGLGFLDRNETDNPKFIIENEYYRDQSESIEVATNIEITALQALMNIGYIGLAVHIAFFFYTWWIVRRCRHRLFYLSVMLIFVWFGMAGFEGLIYPMGLEIAALAWAATYLSDKNLSKDDAGK